MALIRLRAGLILQQVVQLRAWCHMHAADHFDIQQVRHVEGQVLDKAASIREHLLQEVAEQKRQLPYS